MSRFLSLALFCLAFFTPWSLPAAGVPKIAVADLAYEERVSEYIHVVKAHQKNSSNAYQGKNDSSYEEVEGSYNYIDRGELHKFTGDIKGALLKLGMRVVQGKPAAAKNSEKLFDIVSRIKKGDFAGADRVLFGVITSIEFREENNPVAGSSTNAISLSLELVVDFSLIDTKTHQITAAFTAMGEGQDTKLLGARGGRVVPSRGRAIAEVSHSLADDVANQLESQLGLTPGDEPRR